VQQRCPSQHPAGWLAQRRKTAAIGRAFKNPNKSVDGGRIAVVSLLFDLNVNVFLTK